jgi:hypothetical protein
MVMLMAEYKIFILLAIAVNLSVELLNSYPGTRLGGNASADLLCCIRESITSCQVHSLHTSVAILFTRLDDQYRHSPFCSRPLVRLNVVAPTLGTK